MNTTKIRTFHKFCAVIMAPFLLLTIATATTLILDHLKILSLLDQQELLIFKIHTWGIIAPYFGLFMAAGLLIIIITGLLLFKK